MKHSKVYAVSGKSQLVIDLPENFKDKDKVLIVIDDVAETKEEKLEKLKEAMNDPLFLADIQEINEDFHPIDGETI